MWQALKLDYVCCTGSGWCQRTQTRVSCLMCQVQSLISPLLPLLPPLSLSRCIFPSSGSGQGTREITRPGPGPASCQLTRKIPGLNWLTPAAKYFADCEYFSSGSGTETLAQGRGEAGPGLRFTIVRVCVAVVWLPPSLLSRNLRYLMANSQPWLAVWASPRLAGPGRPGRV